MAATTEQLNTRAPTTKPTPQDIDSLFPDLTADDRAEVDDRLKPLMEQLDQIRIKLKSMAKQELSQHQHEPHLQLLRTQLDDMETKEITEINGAKAWKWSGPPSKDIPSGQAVLTDLLEQCRELERYIRGAELPKKHRKRHTKRRTGIAERARNWLNSIRAKIMSYTYTSTVIHQRQQ